MNEARIYLVRHGESVGNQENRLQGTTDYELTDLGRIQAELTAVRLASLDVAAVYTSPLLRAQTTAMTIGAALGKTPTALTELREYDFGELAGVTYAELRQRFGGPTIGPDGRPVERVYPGEEGRDVFFRRVTETFWEIAKRHMGESVAIVSHGGPIALLCQTVLGLPYKRPMPFAIDNCSISTVLARGEETPTNPKTVLVGLNDVCHLREAEVHA